MSAPAMLTVEAFADLNHASARTVRRWLAAELLPGATQDRRGRWSIPETCPPPDLRPDKGRRVILGDVVGDGYGTIPIDEALAPARSATRRGVAVVAPEAPRVTLPPRLFLTLAEVAAMTDGMVSERSLAGMCREGEIVGYRRGRSGAWLIPAGEVARLAGIRT